jgi:hypothetical protein
MRVHLAARVPNEGARRLVRWMMRERVPMTALAERAGVSAAMIVRMIEDGLVPASGTIERIAGMTGGFVRGWTKPARGWWFSGQPGAIGSRAAGFPPVPAGRDGGAAAYAPKRPEVAPPMDARR